MTEDARTDLTTMERITRLREHIDANLDPEDYPGQSGDLIALIDLVTYVAERLS